MTHWQEQKDELYRAAIDSGISGVEELVNLGSSVPEEKLRGWLGRMLQVPKKFAPGRRYVNRFKLGADPEFVFSAGGRADAQVLGLKQGPAYGADNNGRLAEIRPHPSRSAVDVVASILTTLRWMALNEPKTLQYQWVAGAYLYDDGLGGHVHFGRKRPFRDAEIRALDAVEEELLGLGVFPADQTVRRRQGDAHRQIYGALGDYRLQTHGYEYRTFPSWLDSPEAAFITLVLSKLVVYAPGVFKPPMGPMMPQRRLQRIKNLLAYFKCTDDDARLALLMLNRGLPRYYGGDFKGRWGINPGMELKYPKIEVIPLSIKPDEESRKEVFGYLMQGAPLQWRIPAPTWSPTACPKGYRMCLELTNTYQQKGLGEMIWDLCTSKGHNFIISGGEDRGYPITVASEWLRRFPSDWKKKFPMITTSRGMNASTILVTKAAREKHAKATRAVLLSGLFPIWKVGEVKPESVGEWDARMLGKKQERKFRGSVVWESSTHRIGELI